MDARTRTWLYGGLALAAGVGLVIAAKSSHGSPALPGGSPFPRGQRLKPGARLLLVGDSLAVGLTAPLGRLAADAGLAFAADARGGTAIFQWAKTWLGAALAAAKPTLVLISLGTNDMASPWIAKDPSKFDEPGAARSMVAQIRAAGAEPVWVAPPTMPFPDNNGIRPLIASLGVDVFPSEALEIQRVSDKIHATALGYAGWAGALWKWL